MQPLQQQQHLKLRKLHVQHLKPPLVLCEEAFLLSRLNLFDLNGAGKKGASSPGSFFFVLIKS
jgi:hypothetical protein